MSFFARLFRKPSSPLLTGPSTGASPSSLLRRNSTPADIPRSSEERNSTDDLATSRHTETPLRRGALDSKEPVNWMNARKSVDFLESALYQAGIDGSAFETLSGFVHLHTGKKAVLVYADDRILKRKVVLKVYRRETLPPSELESVKSEIRLLKQAHNNPGVLRLESTVENAVMIALITEKCTGGTLMEHISKRSGRISELTAGAELIPQLLQTLCQLHSIGIVHRNLKPEHIVRNNDRWKLIDFATAASLRTDHLNYRTGTLQYMAPEVLEKPTAEEVFHEVILKGMSEEELPCYSEKADIWSLGIVLYESLTGTYPFIGETAAEMLQTIHTAVGSGLHNCIFQQCNHLSAECKDFLIATLTIRPEQRLSAAELLKHPWLTRCRANHDIAPVHNLHTDVPEESFSQFKRLLSC